MIFTDHQGPRRCRPWRQLGRLGCSGGKCDRLEHGVAMHGAEGSASNGALFQWPTVNQMVIQLAQPTSDADTGTQCQ